MALTRLASRQSSRLQLVSLTVVVPGDVAETELASNSSNMSWSNRRTAGDEFGMPDRLARPSTMV